MALRYDDVPRKAQGLADFIARLARAGIISLSRALNSLDRLAWRMEEMGQPDAADAVSGVYMSLKAV
ncbi:MAG TPA: hypothetical protein VHD37_00950 [Candidatus Paceibacterota bacterium]|nr:hypothetical protein [Candidatus Paceibacterota bacterium]